MPRSKSLSLGVTQENTGMLMPREVAIEASREYDSVMKKRVSMRTRRITLSLPADLVRRVDARSRSMRASRSSVVAEMLRASEQATVAAALRAEIEEYYRGGDDDPELSKALYAAGREVWKRLDK